MVLGNIISRKVWLSVSEKSLAQTICVQVSTKLQVLFSWEADHVEHVNIVYVYRTVGLQNTVGKPIYYLCFCKKTQSKIFYIT